jgi:hypothetical protein
MEEPMTTAALLDDDLAFDRSLARQYANATWSQLAFVYLGGPIVAVFAAFLPMGGVVSSIAILLIVAGALATVLRTAMMPATVRPHASLVERFVQFGAGLFPVVFMGVPLAMWAAWVLVAGYLTSVGWI